MQFKEHVTGQKSSDAKMAKLDKLARLLNVKIHVDGVAYGKIDSKEETIIISEDDIVVEEPIEQPKPKRTKSKKVVDKSQET
jgi:hypothetical protein